MICSNCSNSADIALCSMILSEILHPTRPMQTRMRVQRFRLFREIIISFDTVGLIFSYRGIPNNVINRENIFVGGNHRTNPEHFGCRMTSNKCASGRGLEPIGDVPLINFFSFAHLAGSFQLQHQHYDNDGSSSERKPNGVITSHVIKCPPSNSGPYNRAK